MSNIIEIPQGDVETLRDKLSLLTDTNPQGIIAEALDYLENTAGISVFDNSTPFTSLLGLNAAINANTLSAIDKIDNNTLIHTTNFEEISRFVDSNAAKLQLGSPCSIRFTFVVPMQQLRDMHAMTYTIPKHSKVYDSVNDITFLIRKDIVIYVDKNNSELYTVEYKDETDSVILDSLIKIYDDDELSKEYLWFELELDQLDVTRYVLNITGESFALEHTITDNLYDVIIHKEDPNDIVPVIYTLDNISDIETSSEFAYCSIADNTLNVKIGSYTRTIDNDTLTLYAISTKGAMTIDYNGRQDEFNLELADDSTVDNSVIFTVTSNDYTTGGYDGFNFEQLKDYLIQHGTLNVPLTEEGLRLNLLRRGLLTRKFSEHGMSRSYIGADYTVDKSNINIPMLDNINIVNGLLDMPLEDFVDKHGVYIRPGIVQLSKECIYILSDDKTTVRLLSTSEVALLDSDSDYHKRMLESDTLMVSPFSYMIDLTGPVITVKAYVMDNPSLDNLRFYYTSLTNRTIRVIAQEITPLANGYKLSIVVDSEEDDYAVWVTLNQETGARVKCIENTVDAVEKGKLFEVVLTTDKMVKDNKLLVTGVVTDDSSDFTVVDIESEFTINIVNKLGAIYTDHQGMYRTTGSLGSVLLSSLDITYKLGEHLTWLWVGENTVESKAKYLVAEDDIPLLYTHSVLGDITMDTTTCTIEYNTLHEKDDPVLDDNGQPVFKYKKGNYILDDEGNKIVTGYTGVSQRFYVTLVDFFNRYPNSLEETYKYAIKDIVAQSTTTASSLNDDLLENTSIYYSPRGQFTNVKILNSTAELPRQGLTVTVYIPTRYKPNDDTLENITKAIKELVYTTLNNEVVNLSYINTEENTYSSIISSVQVAPVTDTEGNDHSVFTYADNKYKLVPSNNIDKVNGVYKITPGVEVVYRYI